MNVKSLEGKVDESWMPILRPFVESKECDEIYKVLKSKAKAGVKISPAAENTWNPFKHCKYTDLKVCIIGDFPLDWFYWQINKDVYPAEEIEASEDLRFLGLQGVLMLPNSLTSEKGKRHEDLWLPLYEYLITKIFNLQNNGLVYILLGEAKIYNLYISIVNSHILYAEPGKNTNVFSQANSIIEGNNGKDWCIHWDSKFFEQYLNTCPF